MKKDDHKITPLLPLRGPLPAPHEHGQTNIINLHPRPGIAHNASISAGNPLQRPNNKIAKLRPCERSSLDVAIGSQIYTDRPLPTSQIILSHTFTELARQAIPGNIQLLCDNAPVETYRKYVRAAPDATLTPTRLELIVWAAISAIKDHAGLRSHIVNDSSSVSIITRI